MAPHEHKQFEQVLSRIEPRGALLHTWNLSGGPSARVTAVAFRRDDGRTGKIVVRRYGDADLRQNPDVASDEFTLLHILQTAGVPVPAPIWCDESAEVFPVPYIVLAHVDGDRGFDPASVPDGIAQLAATLTQIHRLAPPAADLGFLPRQEAVWTERLRSRPAPPDESPDERRARSVLRSAWPLAPRNAPALLHGDFWPGNTLWKEGRLVAVVDWEDAAVGDPLADVATARLEILWAFGIDAMREFTHRYASLAPGVDFTDLPYWDLCADLRLAPGIAAWGLDDAAERALREGRRLFLAQALDRLAGRYPLLTPP